MGDLSRVGHAPFRDHTTADAAGARIVVDVAIGVNKTQVEVIVDTGGTWIVLDPELADLTPTEHDSQVELVVRGEMWIGHLVRSVLVLLADHGEDLTIEGTFFVPDLDPGDTWPHPSFLGWAGGLERIWFAVDPARSRCSFAPLDHV